jgi:hypothetical protein
MFKKIVQFALPAILFFIINVAHADDSLFSTNLYAKFQAKACTKCHDFYDKDKNGLSFNTHAKRLDVNRCAKCHKEKVTGFDHASEWFAQPGLYTSGLDAKETCEKTKEALNAAFKSKDLLAEQLETHLLTDPRVLWGIEGAMEESGNLPFKKKEAGIVKGGMAEWEEQVMAWIKGGMKCE